MKNAAILDAEMSQPTVWQRANTPRQPPATTVATPVLSRPAHYKRPLDLAILVLALVALLPLWLPLVVAIPLAIWLEDRGPIFYRQRRLGRAGRVFEVVKFRTMVNDAERHTGPVWAAAEDSRVTKVGKALRRFHLDELPQLFNIARGDMSLVGPRPERPELATRWYHEVPGFSRRLSVRPGIAGLAQARGGYHATPRQKLKYDMLYITSMNPLLDLWLLALCIWSATKSMLPRLPRKAPRRPAERPMSPNPTRYRGTNRMTAVPSP